MPTSVLGKVRQTLLAYGDLFMMRKQLITLKRCAEKTAERGTRTADRRPAGASAGMTRTKSPGSRGAVEHERPARVTCGGGATYGWKAHNLVEPRTY
jgi:hypothetical protein